MYPAIRKRGVSKAWELREFLPQLRNAVSGVTLPGNSNSEAERQATDDAISALRSEATKTRLNDPRMVLLHTVLICLEWALRGNSVTTKFRTETGFLSTFAHR